MAVDSPRGESGRAASIVLSVLHPDGRTVVLGRATPPLVRLSLFRPLRMLWYRLVEAPAFERNVAAHNALVAAMTSQEGP
ncbi:MAG: hypothetical protein ABSD03_10975 [Vulcanimicrobiaceae bacterium]|jgi:hypothetical protein